MYCSTAMSSRLTFSGLIPSPRPMRSALLKEIACGSEYAGTIFFTLLTTVLTSQPLAAGIRSPIFASIRY
ncbi:hypothetical protein D3C74_462770 [compost metagenome]